MELPGISGSGCTSAELSVIPKSLIYYIFSTEKSHPLKRGLNAEGEKRILISYLHPIDGQVSGSNWIHVINPLR